VTPDVVVVDDAPRLRRSLLQLIRECDYKGLAVGAGEDATAQLARASYLEPATPRRLATFLFPVGPVHRPRATART
jgi:CheY-like chemotaxis protein